MFKELNWGSLSKYRNQLFGISIITIIIFHWCLDVIELNEGTGNVWYRLADGYNTLILSTGVEIFLLLSGMGLYRSFDRNHDLLRFYKNRVVRMLPTYFTLGLLFWIIIDFGVRHTGVSEFIHDLFWVTFVTKGRSTVWFVPAIIGFYCIFPLLYYLAKRNEGSVSFYFIYTLAVLLILALIKQTSGKFYQNTEIALNRILIFSYGVFLAPRILNSDPFRKRDLFLPVFGIFLKVFRAWLPTTGISYPSRLFSIINSRIVNCFYVFVPLLIYVVLLSLSKRSTFVDKILVFAGAHSLELYLTHIMLRTIFRDLGIHPGYALNELILVVLAVILSWADKKLVGRLLERT